MDAAETIVFSTDELTLENIREHRRQLKRALRALGLPRDVLEEVMLAVGELVTNVVLHQLEKAVSCKIGLACESKTRSVKISLFGVNYIEAPKDDKACIDLIVPKGNGRDGGCGLWFVSQLVDEYEPLPDSQGVYLTKKWEIPTGPDEESGSSYVRALF